MARRVLSIVLIFMQLLRKSCRMDKGSLRRIVLCANANPIQTGSRTFRVPFTSHPRGSTQITTIRTHKSTCKRISNNKTTLISLSISGTQVPTKGSQVNHRHKIFHNYRKRSRVALSTGNTAMKATTMPI